MGLESGTYIDDLVETNPVTATDSVTEGAAHLRLVKDVLKNTFPNYDEPVTLSPAQLNDAALKSVAQTITGAWTHDASIIFANNIPLRGKNFAGDTNLVLARVNASDVGEFGNDGMPVDYFSDATGQAWYIAAVQTMTLEAGAGNGLQVEKITGGLARVPTLGDVNIYTVRQKFDAPLEVKNNNAMQWRESDDTTTRTVLIVDGTNLCKVGNANLDMQIRASAEVAVQIAGTDEVAEFIPKADGSVNVMDRGGVYRKAGFRNPGLRTINANASNSQDDEGGVIQVGTASITLTIDSLEPGTSYVIFGNQGPFTLSRGTGVTTFRHLGGLDGVSTFVTASCVRGSALQIYHNSAGTVTVFGGGLTPN